MESTDHSLNEADVVNKKWIPSAKTEIMRRSHVDVPHSSIQASHRDYASVVEKSIGIPAVHHATTTTESPDKATSPLTDKIQIYEAANINPPRKPLRKNLKQHKTHPTLCPEDLDENSTLEDLLGDWGVAPNSDRQHRRTGENSPYMHTLYPAKELSVPQRLYFSKMDKEKGERLIYMYEIVKGDTLRGVARKLEVTMQVVVGAAPLFVDGEFE